MFLFYDHRAICHQLFLRVFQFYSHIHHDLLNLRWPCIYYTRIFIYLCSAIQSMNLEYRFSKKRRLQVALNFSLQMTTNSFRNLWHTILLKLLENIYRTQTIFDLRKALVVHYPQRLQLLSFSLKRNSGHFFLWIGFWNHLGLQFEHSSAQVQRIFVNPKLAI